MQLNRLEWGDATVNVSVSPNVSTSNGNIGVVMRWDGNIATNGNNQALKVLNGNISVPLSFTPVKPTGVSYENIATGAFNASVTLVITRQ